MVCPNRWWAVESHSMPTGCRKHTLEAFICGTSTISTIKIMYIAISMLVLQQGSDTLPKSIIGNCYAE